MWQLVGDWKWQINPTLQKLCNNLVKNDVSRRGDCNLFWFSLLWLYLWTGWSSAIHIHCLEPRSIFHVVLHKTAKYGRYIISVLCKIILNIIIRSTFCGQWMVQTHRTPVCWSTSVGRWIERPRWIHQSIQSIYALVEQWSWSSL